MATNQLPAGQKQQPFHTLGERSQAAPCQHPAWPRASGAGRLSRQCHPRRCSRHRHREEKASSAGMLPAALSCPERVGKSPARLGLLGAGPAQVSTTLPSQPARHRHSCRGALLRGHPAPPLPACPSYCKLAAGHEDSPQPQDRPTTRLLTVSLGCTRCWNESKASWEVPSKAWHGPNFAVVP